MWAKIIIILTVVSVQKLLALLRYFIFFFFTFLQVHLKTIQENGEDLLLM